MESRHTSNSSTWSTKAGYSERDRPDRHTAQTSGGREATCLRPGDGAGRRERALCHTVARRNAGVEGVVRTHVKALAPVGGRGLQVEYRPAVVGARLSRCPSSSGLLAIRQRRLTRELLRIHTRGCLTVLR